VFAHVNALRADTIARYQSRSDHRSRNASYDNHTAAEIGLLVEQIGIA
jgi:hypothetical protein